MPYENRDKLELLIYQIENRRIPQPYHQIIQPEDFLTGKDVLASEEVIATEEVIAAEGGIAVEDGKAVDSSDPEFTAKS